MSLAHFDTAPQRPLWLITLADLSLLLLGFFVFLQASRSVDAASIADGVRRAFGGEPVEATPTAMAMPLDLAIVGGFAPGSAELPDTARDVAAWVREASRDPRTTVALTGVTRPVDDVDGSTGSRDILAADRARAVAALLITARAIDPERIRIGASATGARPQVTLTIGFAGERP